MFLKRLLLLAVTFIFFLAYFSCTTPKTFPENKNPDQSSEELNRLTIIEPSLKAPIDETPDLVKSTSSPVTEKPIDAVPLSKVVIDETEIVHRNAVKHIEKIATENAGSFTSNTSPSPTQPVIETIPVPSRITEEYDYSPSYYEEYTSPIVSPEAASRTINHAAISALAGQLTAGEINDFQKWEMWEDIAANELEVYQKLWQIAPGKRYTVLVQNATGNAVVDANVELVGSNGESIWTSRTDNTGKAELWGKMASGMPQQTPDHILVTSNKTSEKINRIVPTEKGINLAKLPIECDVAENIELLFTVDATGSMGDEIEFLQAELVDVISKIKNTHPELNVKLGSVFYRDHGDTYVTKNSELSEDISITNAFIAEQYADGGGDGPEAVDDALAASINEIAWSQNARARLMFMILDAPPHQEIQHIERIQKNIALAAQKGIRIIPIVASGGGFEMDKSLEYLMRTWALATNGTYAFLTDHSGIGDAHTAPTTDKYDVEKLNDLLVRIIDQFIYTPSCNPEEWTELAEQPDTSSFSSNDLISLQIAADSSAISGDSLMVEVPLDIFEIHCYPNPATDYVMIRTSEQVDEMFVADNAGKLIQRITPIDLLTRIDMTGYPSGLYHVKAWNNNRSASVRIVVAHI
jgi:hypothetical protein